jgi:hypothetical protein
MPAVVGRNPKYIARVSLEIAGEFETWLDASDEDERLTISVVSVADDRYIDKLFAVIDAVNDPIIPCSQPP